MAFKAWRSYADDLKDRQELYFENGQEFCEDLYTSEDDELYSDTAHKLANNLDIEDQI